MYHSAEPAVVISGYAGEKPRELSPNHYIITSLALFELLSQL
jgi:hypothetical protein